MCRSNEDIHARRQSVLLTTRCGVATPVKVMDARHFLQKGSTVKKKTRTALIQSWKSKYLWLSEDLLIFRWCKGETKNWEESEKKESKIYVENMSQCYKTSDSEIQITLFDAPEVPLTFQVTNADQWVKNITMLCTGKLAYRLLWDRRDTGCEISLHFKADDVWFPGTIVGFNEVSKQHQIVFQDGKPRLYSLSNVFFRVEQLPSDRRDHRLYDRSGTQESKNQDSVVHARTERRNSITNQTTYWQSQLKAIAKSSSTTTTTTTTTTTRTTSTNSSRTNDVIQQKVFTKWCNWYLSSLNVQINTRENGEKELFKDLQNGVLLCYLVEELGQSKISETLKGKFINENPTKISDNLENAHRIHEYCERKGIKISDAAPKEIAEGKERTIMSLIWQLIMGFPRVPLSVRSSGSTMIKMNNKSRSIIKGSTRNELLKWCRDTSKKSSGFTQRITNFKQDWKNGLAFIAIIHGSFPDSQIINSTTDFQHLDVEDRLEQAFTVAENTFHLPKLLDISDIIGRDQLDEKSICTYIAALRVAILGYQENQQFHKDATAEDNAEQLELFNIEGSSGDDSDSDEEEEDVGNEMFNVEGSSSDDDSDEDEDEVHLVDSIHEEVDDVLTALPFTEVKQNNTNVR